MSRRSRQALAVGLLWLACGAGLAAAPPEQPADEHDPAAHAAALAATDPRGLEHGVLLQVLPADARKAVLYRDPATGRPVYLVHWEDRPAEVLTPEQFASRLHHDVSEHRLLYTLLNITSPLGIAWVALGLLGQVLFTGRMVVQWLASERQHRSVVPVSFWWMSLVGATMLLVYFGWRRDPVALLGQAAAWGIYVRNLYLIYVSGKLPPSDSAGTESPPPAKPTTVVTGNS